jgi:hypothetical protein
MRFAAICIALCMCLTVVSLAQQLRPPPPVPLPEAPVGFDNQSNGMVDDVTHQADLARSTPSRRLPKASGRSTTRSRAANAIRIRYQAVRAR